MLEARFESTKHPWHTITSFILLEIVKIEWVNRKAVYTDNDLHNSKSLDESVKQDV